MPQRVSISAATLPTPPMPTIATWRRRRVREAAGKRALDGSRQPVQLPLLLCHTLAAPGAGRAEQLAAQANPNANPCSSALPSLQRSAGEQSSAPSCPGSLHSP